MKESILQKFIRLFRDIDKEILPNANVLERMREHRISEPA